jgi:hypothetical protein
MTLGPEPNTARGSFPRLLPKTNAVVDITISADGVAALDAATGKFALTVTETVNTGMFFCAPQNGVKQLVLTTTQGTEPSTMSLFGMGIALLGVARLCQIRR